MLRKREGFTARSILDALHCLDRDEIVKGNIVHARMYICYMSYQEQKFDNRPPVSPVRLVNENRAFSTVLDRTG